VNLPDVVDAHIPFVLNSQKSVRNEVLFQNQHSFAAMCQQHLQSQAIDTQASHNFTVLFCTHRIVVCLSGFHNGQGLPVHIDICDVHRLNQCA
jgi:hypothetical protein